MQDTTDDIEDKAKAFGAAVWIVICLAAAVPIFGIALVIWAF